jgi:hypothetical protein
MAARASGKRANMRHYAQQPRDEADYRIELYVLLFTIYPRDELSTGSHMET